MDKEAQAKALNLGQITRLLAKPGLTKIHPLELDSRYMIRHSRLLDHHLNDGKRRRSLIEENEILILIKTRKMPLKRMPHPLFAKRKISTLSYANSGEAAPLSF